MHLSFNSCTDDLNLKQSLMICSAIVLLVLLASPVVSSEIVARNLVLRGTDESEFTRNESAARREGSKRNIAAMLLTETINDFARTICTKKNYFKNDEVAGMVKYQLRLLNQYNESRGRKRITNSAFRIRIHSLTIHSLFIYISMLIVQLLEKCTTLITVSNICSSLRPKYA